MKTLKLITISLGITGGIVLALFIFVKLGDALVYIGQTYGMIYVGILAILILFILVFTIVKKTIL